MDNKTPKISIIVPVYKAENTLNRCVDSLLVQSFNDFEILLVDDGSPDSSGDICDKYAKQYSCIRAFHKKNGGVSSARNLGINKAKGQWVCFVDSDDWVGEHYLDGLNHIEDNVEIVHFGFQKEYSNGKVEACFEFENERVISLNEFLCKGIFSSCSVSYYFSYDLIKDLLFNENVCYSEDREFIIKAALSSTNKIQLIHNVEYIYTYNINSVTCKKRTGLRCLDDLVVLENIAYYVKDNNLYVEKESENYIYKLLIESFFISFSTMCNDRESIITLSKERIKSINLIFSSQNMNVILFLFSPFLIVLKYKIYWRIRTLYYRYIK